MSEQSDEYNAWLANSASIPTVHSYYFSVKGNLLGLVPSTNIVFRMDGPFKTFHTVKRILVAQDGSMCILPIGKEEKTNMPTKLFERTKKELKRLSS